jgi:hypothetical protein
MVNGPMLGGIGGLPSDLGMRVTPALGRLLTETDAGDWIGRAEWLNRGR